MSHTSAYVSIRQHTSASRARTCCVSPYPPAPSPPAAAPAARAAPRPRAPPAHLLRQILYFCTSNASKLSTSDPASASSMETEGASRASISLTTCCSAATPPAAPLTSRCLTSGPSVACQSVAYVSIRQRASAYVSMRQRTAAYGSVHQRTAVYVSIRQHTSAYVSIRQHTSAYVNIRQHTSAYVSIRPGSALTSWYACLTHADVRECVARSERRRTRARRPRTALCTDVAARLREFA